MAIGQLNFNQNASVVKGRTDKSGGGARDLFNPRGFFAVEHWRHGLLIGTYRFKNGIVNEGKNSIFDIYFDVGTKLTEWYMLLVDLTGFTALAATDTYDDINQGGNGWTEFTAYDDPVAASSATRPVWNPDPASGQSISNSTQTIFDITASGTVKGLGIVGGPPTHTNASLKDDHAPAGVLWATALFDQGDTAVVNGDQLKITYTVSA